jgi:hypothetical protein
MPFAVFLALFTARQDYRRVASISIVQYRCRDDVHAVVHSALAPGLDVSWLSGARICNEPASGLRWSRHVIGDWLARPAIHRGALGNLVKLGGWQFAAQSWRADCRTGGSLLARSSAAAAVRRILYDCAAVGKAMYIRCSKGQRILFPFFSTLQEADDREADLLFRSSWILNVLAASARGGLIPVRPIASSVDRRRSGCRSPACW